MSRAMSVDLPDTHVSEQLTESNRTGSVNTDANGVQPRRFRHETVGQTHLLHGLFRHSFIVDDPIHFVPKRISV